MLSLAPFLLLATGCQQPVSSRLVGDWVGKPDSSAAAAQRSAELKAKQRKESGEEAAAPSDDVAEGPRTKTDLEQHDVTIQLTFANDKTVHMSLGDGSQPLNGTWRLVESLPPRGAEIEISLQKPATAEGESETKTPVGEKRRFVVDFQSDETTAGYTLVEKGADPQFGRLYFVKKD